MTEIVIVSAAFDPAGAVWIAHSPEVAGLHVTSPTWIGLIEGLPAAVIKCLQRGAPRCPRDVAIEIIAHVSTRVTVPGLHRDHRLAPTLIHTPA